MKRHITKTAHSITLFLFVFCFLTNVNAQHNTSELPTSISASGTAPDASAMLDVQSTNKGILIPRVANTSAISNPAEGLMIYDNSVNAFKYYDGSTWEDFGGVDYISFPADGNSFIGIDAGAANTTGDWNLATGYFTLQSNTTGKNNTAIGSVAMRYNTTGDNNTACGRVALLDNTTGDDNTANGYRALFNNTTGDNNTANGTSALHDNTTGSSNVAIGKNSLYNNTTRSNLVAVGDYALYNNGVGVVNSSQAISNTAVGSRALYSNTQGSYNTANGYHALTSNIYGSNNTAIGYHTLYSNTAGDENIAVGSETLYSNTTGDKNIAIGSETLYYNTTGESNIASGLSTLKNNTTGDFNIAFGNTALLYNVTGSYNIAIGAAACFLGDYNNSTTIGAFADPNGSDRVRLGNSSITQIGGYANWSNISDARFKTQIQSDVPGLAFISLLNPVTYQMDMDAIAKHHHTPDSLRLAESERAKAAIRYTGFLAQEVEKAAESVAYDFSGVDKPQHERDNYSLRYAEFVVPLVKAVQELDAENKAKEERIATLERKNADLEVRLKTIEALLQQRVD